VREPVPLTGSQPLSNLTASVLQRAIPPREDTPMTLVEVDLKIAETTDTLKLLKKLRKAIAKTEQLKTDLSKSK
jgi:hypothetical protein